MSDPTIPQKPRFEETKAFKDAYADYDRSVYTAIQNFDEEHENTPDDSVQFMELTHRRALELRSLQEKWHDTLVDLRAKYDQGEL